MNDIELHLGLMYLEQLAIKRDMKLDRIALSEMMRMDRQCDFPDVSEIQKDNLLTDAQMRWHFLHPKIHPEVTELHLSRCIKSDVPFCRCIPDKRITGGDLL